MLWMIRTMRIGISAVVVFAALSAPARANYCAEAWVLRNMIFDRLGHCFGSHAGQMLFDNSDCRVSGPTPPPQQSEAIRFIREGEAHVGCQIDTSAPPSPAMREAHATYAPFIDLPAPDYVGGYGCIGYRGSGFTLHAGASRSASVVGQTEAGMMIVASHYSVFPGWEFLKAVDRGTGKAVVSGWTDRADIGPDNCDQVAG